MKEDAVMERIHEVRRQLFMQNGKSVPKLFEYIKQVEAANSNKVVNPTHSSDEKPWIRPCRAI